MIFKKAPVSRSKYLLIGQRHGPQKPQYIELGYPFGPYDDVLYLSRETILIKYNFFRKNKIIRLEEINKIMLRFGNTGYAYIGSNPDGIITLFTKTRKKYEVLDIQNIYNVLIQILWNMDKLDLKHPEIVYWDVWFNHWKIDDLKEFEEWLEKINEKDRINSYFKGEPIMEEPFDPIKQYKCWRCCYINKLGDNKCKRCNSKFKW